MLINYITKTEGKNFRSSKFINEKLIKSISHSELCMLLDSQASEVPTLLDASLILIKEIEGPKEEDSVFIDQEEVHEINNEKSSN